MSNTLDFAQQNELIQSTLLDEISTHYPIQGDKYSLNIKTLEIDDNLASNDYPKQKEIKLKRGTWHVPLYANVELVENDSGKVVDSIKKMKIANVPKLTNRFSLIIGGNEYQPLNQFRLKSGVYTRRQANGELESRFNLEKGFNFRMTLDETNGIFYIILKNKKYRLYNLLHSLDVPDDQLKKAWGDEVFNSNFAKALNTEHQDIINLYNGLTNQDVSDYPTALKELKSYLNNTKMSGETTKITLGESHESVNPASLIKTSVKLLGVTRGDETTDDRDSLIFKELYSVEDLLSSYFKAQTPAIVKGIQTRLNKPVRAGEEKNIRNIMSSSLYSKPLKTFFISEQHGLSTTPEQTNPAKMITDWRKTTVTGTGGIQSRHAITMDARDVHPSHLGFIDPVSTPEGEKIGVTTGLSVDVEKDGRELVIPIEKLNGRKVKRSIAEVYDMKIGMPDQMVIVNGKPVAKHSKVKGFYQGKPAMFKASEIDGYIPQSSSLFNYSTNLIPFIPHNSGNRMSMGSRMSDQAISLTDPDAPNIQTYYDKSTSFQEEIGNFLNPVAGLNGEVTKVTKDYVYLKGNDGSKQKVGLYNNFPLNGNNFLHSSPLVEVGDTVKTNTILAENNYNDDGALAIGKNVNIAYMSWNGVNWEDSAVATESFAKSFTSEKLIRKNVFTDNKRGVLDKKKFRLLYPDQLSASNAAKLDTNGIIRIGETVEPDDVLVAYLESTDLSPEEKILAKMNKITMQPYRKLPLVWDEDSIGEVVYVTKTGRNVDVHIKTKKPLVVGDKVAGRYGNKAIVSKIIPDDEAPHTKDGTRIDLMVSPYGVPSRMNIGQLLETALGKYAEKTGKKIVINNFDDSDQLKKVVDTLKKAGIPIDEKLTDGINGKEFENDIFWGNQYVMKLMHEVSKKVKTRETGSYDINMQPSKGKKSGQTMGSMEVMAMISHGAKENLREMSTIKGQQNDEYWRSVQLGLPTPPPQQNFVFDKMLAYLQQSGVNVEKNGDQFSLFPLTDKHVRDISNGEIPDPGRMVIAKNLAARPGGTFDPEITGGAQGKKWSHIKLNTKIPNPVFEPAIQKLLNLTQNEYEKVINKEVEIDGRTGFKAIGAELKKIDINETLKELKQELKTANAQEVNKLNKKIRYLQALRKFDLDPTDYMIKYVPVLPPIYRPIYPLPGGDLMVSPINKHYKDVGTINNAIGDVKDQGLPEDFNDKNEIQLYKSVKALQGLADPVTYGGKKYEGSIKTLIGNSPKTGFIHSRMWSKKQDMTARSTATLDPSLGIDEVGLPDKIAKDLFKPFVVQKMVQLGYKATEALDNVKEWTPVADQMLDSVLEERPVLMNRAPTLHKHGIQAFKASRNGGKSITTNPLINKGFNLDYDGDTVGIHVPVSQAAVSEAWNMVPSKNIFKHGDMGVIHELSRDYLHGLYFLTKEGKNTRKKFPTLAAASKDKNLHMTDVFTVKGKKYTLGKIAVNAALPEPLRDYVNPFNSQKVDYILTELGKNYKNDYANVINSFKDLGNQWGHRRGTTLSLNDVIVKRTKRDRALVEAAKKSGKDEKKITKYFLDAAKSLESWEDLPDTNNFKQMIESGGHGNPSQVRQILYTPGLVQNVKGDIVPHPITTGYAEGLDSFDYWNTMPGVRKGSVDKSINVSESGALNKALLNVTRKMIVTIDDCNTDDYIELDVSNNKQNIMDRTLARNTRGPGKRNDLIDMIIYNGLIENDIDKVKVRSPLKCEAPNGVCAKCYGALPGGMVPSIGYNVGVADGQAVTERSTQLTMRTFHTGGAAGTNDAAAGFGRILQLLEVPETLSNRAILATRGGKITSIESNALGGKNVIIDNVAVLKIPSNRQLIVRKGNIVQKGQALTTGNIKPQELAELTSHEKAQNYIVDELDKVYDGKFHKKTFETVLRAVSNNAEVTEAPDDSDFIRGDRTTSHYLDDVNKARKQAGKDPIKYKKYFRSIKMLPGDSQDWLSRLGTSRLKQTIQDGAAMGMSSSIHGADPIPAYMYGLEFGQDNEGKYPY